MMHRTRRFATLLLLFIGMLAATHAARAQTSDDFEVRVEVLDTCVLSAQDLDFGTYDPNSTTPTTGTATITATCTLGTVFDVALDAGTEGTSVADRKMADDATGLETLDYGLSCVGLGVPACATNWGETAGTDTFTSVGTGLAIPVVVTGTIAAGQQVTPGQYRDTPVTATVVF